MSSVGCKTSIHEICVTGRGGDRPRSYLVAGGALPMSRRVSRLMCGAHGLPLVLDLSVVLREDVANGSGAAQRDFRVIRELLREALIAPRARSLGQLRAERRALLEGSERGPERGVECLGLTGEQGVRGPCVPNAASEADEISLTQLPKRAATVGTTEWRE